MLDSMVCLPSKPSLQLRSVSKGNIQDILHLFRLERHDLLWSLDVDSCPRWFEHKLHPTTRDRQVQLDADLLCMHQLDFYYSTHDTYDHRPETKTIGCLLHLID